MNEKRYLVYAFFGLVSSRRQFDKLEYCYKFVKYSKKKGREIWDRKECCLIN